MAICEKLFREELYIEHLEEAAFLYETRLAWLHDDEIGWFDLEDIDYRMDAHIDALLAGGALALRMCLQRLADAEFSALHVIVRVFCRERSIDNLAKVWAAFDFSDGEKVTAVADALKWECPVEWHSHLPTVFVQGRLEMFPVLLPAVVYFRLEACSALTAALPLAKPQDVKSLLWAISKTAKKSDTAVVSVLKNYLSDGDIKIREQAIYGLLRTGDKTGIEYLRRHAREFPCLLAISGSGGDIKPIREMAEKGVADEDCLIALGLAGDLQAIYLLTGYLKHPDLAAMAALALNIISGANLYEDVHVVDEMSEEELFPEEVDAFKQGVLPKNINGQPYGNIVTQLQLDRELWLSWFDKNKARFISGLRYRNGKPISPDEAVNTLIDNRTPYKIRQLAYEEMVIRYGLDLPFQVGDLVNKQESALNEIYHWAIQVRPQFSPGRWYLFAELC